MDVRDVVMVAEEADDLLGLAEAHQAVIDEDAGELIADRLVDQHRRDGAVDAAGKAANHLPLAHLLADLRDLGRAKHGHGPVAGKTTTMPSDTGEKTAPAGRAGEIGV